MTWFDPAPGPADSCPAAPPPGLATFEVTFSQGTATLVITGELDLNTMPLLSERLSLILRREPRRLVVDMTRTGFMDCGSARLITGAVRSLPDAGQLVIRRPSPAVRRVLELTTLDAGCEIQG
jgi:anti-sigma B factor antagonist